MKSSGWTMRTWQQEQDNAIMSRTRIFSRIFQVFAVFCENVCERKTVVNVFPNYLEYKYFRENSRFSRKFRTAKNCRELKVAYAGCFWRVADGSVRVIFWREFEGSTSVLPSARLMYGEYWFRLSRLSMILIGSFAFYTKTKSVESAVWCLLTLDDDVETGNGYLNR